MFTASITSEILSRSVIAVPPLARHGDLSINVEANRKMMAYLEAGGITNILYGGNANFYHICSTQFREVLQLLQQSAGENSWIIPSVGPTFGVMMEQANVLREFDFPTAMVLPMTGMTTSDGVEEGFKHFVDAYGKPAVLYIKLDGYLDPEAAARLVDRGYVSAIKYAIVRENPAQDAYLSRLVDCTDRRKIVSGIGEQPAIVHARDFGLTGFTSGCVCVAPRRSMSMLAALQARRFDEAENIRAEFDVLEFHRNDIHPIRVLHDAVTLTGIADMGSTLPLLSNLSAEQRITVKAAADKLLQYEIASHKAS